jgi:hypothetical protein
MSTTRDTIGWTFACFLRDAFLAIVYAVGWLYAFVARAVGSRGDIRVFGCGERTRSHQTPQEETMFDKLKQVWQFITLLPFIVIWAWIEAFAPQPASAGVRSLAPLATTLPSDVFTMTLGAAIAWLTSTGIALALAYVVSRAGLSDQWAEPIKYIGNLVLVALMTGIAHYLQPQWLDMRLIDAAIALVTFLVNQAGLMLGSLSGMEHRVRLVAARAQIVGP